MTVNKLFKILLLPYVYVVIIAMALGKKQSIVMMGNNLLNEYLFVLLCFVIYEAQVFVIAKINDR